MNPAINQAGINSLHQSFVQLTGRQETLTMQKIFTWENWLINHWTAEDLKLVVEHIKAGIKKGRRNVAALKFHNLIGNTEAFDGDLSEAKALKRVPIPDKGRVEVLKATHREREMPKNTTKHVSEVINTNWKADLDALKQQLGMNP